MSAVFRFLFGWVCFHFIMVLCGHIVFCNRKSRFSYSCSSQSEQRIQRNTHIHNCIQLDWRHVSAGSCMYTRTVFPDGPSNGIKKNINQDANIYIVIYLNYFITLLSVIICRILCPFFFRSCAFFCRRICLCAAISFECERRVSSPTKRRGRSARRVKE